MLEFPGANNTAAGLIHPFPQEKLFCITDL